MSVTPAQNIAQTHQQSRQPGPARRFFKLAFSLTIELAGFYTVGSWFFKTAMELGESTKSTPVIQSLVAVDLTNTIPLRPEFMGGFAENHDEGAQEGWVATFQKDYIREKAELKAVIAECKQNPELCHPNIKAFVDMLDKVRQMPDKLERLEAINAWGNLDIKYDFYEANHDNFPRRTLLQLLIDHLEVCYGYSKIKLFAIEETVDLKQDNVRLVIEQVYTDGKIKGTHAVATARIGSQIWVLNNQSYRMSGDTITLEQELQLVSVYSLIEGDVYSLNLPSNQTPLLASNTSFIPIASFNETERAYYRVTTTDTLAMVEIPHVAKNAQPLIAQFDPDADAAGVTKNPIFQIVKGVIEEKYRVEITERPACVPMYAPSAAPDISAPPPRDDRKPRILKKKTPLKLDLQLK